MTDGGSSPTSAGDYDHQIVLLDSSPPSPPGKRSAPPDATTPQGSQPVSPTVSRSSGLRQTTTSGSRKWDLREELARRKYAKWQEGRFQGVDESEAGHAGEVGGGSQHEVEGGNVNTQVATNDALTPDRRQDDPARTAGKFAHSPDKDNSALEVLYENQRGSFMCGVPLFSRKSLLNLDPAPWSTAAFKDSPVDIRDAQPPDPTWVWAWKSWYVDMSADVDEGGWQYSFAFSPFFSWHGTHPWYHSFVRRRRWLRKRVRRQKSDHGGHLPNSEHFMVGSTGGPSNGAKTKNHHSNIDGTGNGKDPRSIQDIESLMTVLRSGRIDREKVEAFSAFLEHGDEEISLLADRVRIF